MSIPSDWKICQLGDVASFHDEQRVPIKAEDRAKRRGDFPYFGASGQIDTIDDFIFDGDFVLLAEDGANILDRSSPIAFQAKGKFWVNNHAHILKAKSATCNEFLVYALEAMRYEKYNTGSAQPKLNREVCETIRLALPPKDEQQLIVEILSDCDSAIEKMSSKLRGQKRQLASLNRTMFNKLDCEMVSLGEISSKISRRNDGDNHPVMTISGANGFLLQSEKYSREMSGQSLERYTLLRKGEFAYNKGNSKSFPQGCIYQLEQDTAVVPFVYVCFSIDDRLNADFYKHLFLSGYLNRQLARLINSGVRNDGLLNINPADFFTCKVPLPSTEEQIKISDIFESMDAVVRNLENQLALLKKQKRGLMQQLLTGKLRVRGSA